MPDENTKLGKYRGPSVSAAEEPWVVPGAETALFLTPEQIRDARPSEPLPHRIVVLDPAAIIRQATQGLASGTSRLL